MSECRVLPPELLALTPGVLRVPASASLDRGIEMLARAVHTACRAGLRGILFREPHLEDGPFLLALERVVDAARDGGADWIGVHDRPHLAAVVRANGVHLGRTSLSARAARRVVGDAITIGVSLHAGGDVSNAESVDYAFLSPVRAPRSKPTDDRAVLGARGFLSYAEDIEAPLWALGGIDLGTLDDLAPISARARGVALIGGLWGADDSPIDGTGRSPLQDVEGIAARARSLTARVSTMFRTRESS